MSEPQPYRAFETMRDAKYPWAIAGPQGREDARYTCRVDAEVEADALNAAYAAGAAAARLEAGRAVLSAAIFEAARLCVALSGEQVGERREMVERIRALDVAQIVGAAPTADAHKAWHAGACVGAAWMYGRLGGTAAEVGEIGNLMPDEEAMEARWREWRAANGALVGAAPGSATPTTEGTQK